MNPTCLLKICVFYFLYLKQKQNLKKKLSSKIQKNAP
jgi:hypothetical protein